MSLYHSNLQNQLKTYKMTAKEINVLSLFNGLGCIWITLDRLNIKVNKRYISEIDKYANKVNDANYPDCMQLGSVIDVRSVMIKDNIDLLVGGSPCQSFSFAGKRKGMSTKDNIDILTLEHYLQLKNDGYEFEGQSYLFWEYVRILKEVKPKYFLLENVLMSEKWEKIITTTLGVTPIKINSSLLSAQSRKRLYWTNIGLEPYGLFNDLKSIIKQPKDKRIFIQDIIETNVNDKYFINEKLTNKILKSYKGKNNQLKELILKYDLIITHNLMPRTSKTRKGGTGHLYKLDGKSYNLDTGKSNAINIMACDYRHNEGLRLRSNNKAPTLMSRSGGDPSRSAMILNKTILRLFTPLECERLQTIPDNYTNHVSDSQRYKMIGNGWTVDVIAHILSYMKL